MAEFEQRTVVDAPAERLFDYLKQVENLPEYFDRMEDAEVTDDGVVHTSAHLPEHAPGDSEVVEGEAWFRVDEQEQRIEWGSEGPSDYHGWLAVTGDDQRSEVEVHLSTSRTDDPAVNEGIRATLAHIRQQVEGDVDGPEPGPAHEADDTTQADAGLTG
jgi:uncharacterized membrane protein